MLSNIGENVSDSDKVIKLLSKLPKDYKHFASAIRVTIESVKFDDLLARLLQEENHIKFDIDNNKEESALHVSNKKKTKEFNGNCNFCQKFGHKSKNCFKRIEEEKKIIIKNQKLLLLKQNTKHY